jgi:hypothetical protein
MHTTKVYYRFYVKHPCKAYEPDCSVRRQFKSIEGVKKYIKETGLSLSSLKRVIEEEIDIKEVN